MKKLFFIAALTAASFAGKAQENASNPVKFSIGVEAGIPTGDWKPLYSFVIGGSAQVDYKVAPELALTLNAGYLNLTGKTVNGYKVPSAGLVPVLAGIKYYFGDSKVYGSAQLGVSFATQSGGGSSFTYAPGIGYNFSDNVDAVLKYTGYSEKGGGNSGIVGIRLAYSF